MTTPRVIDPTNYGNAPGEGPLRPGGVSTTSLPISAESNLPSTPSPCAAKQAAALQLVRDVWGGTEVVRSRTVQYLPRAPGEEIDDYNIRLLRSVFVNVFRHTVELLTGYVFRKDPVLGEDVPPQVAEHWENIDLIGTHGDVFLRDSLQDALQAGHAAIFVDYPNTGGRVLSLAEESGPDGARPYWILVHKDDIMSWRTTVEGGRTILMQIVLRERSYVAEGKFGEKEQTRYRVLRRVVGVNKKTREIVRVVTWQVLEITKNNAVTVLDEGICANQTEIPVAEITTSGTKGIFESDPPLLDLAYLNVAHYQQWSDYATSIYKTCVPLLFTAGFVLKDDQGRPIIVGPNAGLNSPNPAGKAEYVSHSGAALGACKAALDDLKNDMAALGVAALASEKRAAETAKAKQIAKSGTDSALAATARGLQDGVERALQFHANYMKLADGGSIKINRDFETATLQADLLTALVGAVEKVGVPERVLLQNMQEGGLIAPDEDLRAMTAEMLTNEAAIMETEQQAAADAMAARQMKALPSQAGVVAPMPKQMMP